MKISEGKIVLLGIIGIVMITILKFHIETNNQIENKIRTEKIEKEAFEKEPSLAIRPVGVIDYSKLDSIIKGEPQ